MVKFSVYLNRHVFVMERSIRQKVRRAFYSRRNSITPLVIFEKIISVSQIIVFIQSVQRQLNLKVLKIQIILNINLEDFNHGLGVG